MFKEKICISRIDKIGDMILTLPVIKSVKIHNPSSEIHVLASTYNAKVLKNIKYVDKVLLIGPNTNSFIKEINQIRKIAYQFLSLVIRLLRTVKSSNSSKSALTYGFVQRKDWSRRIWKYIAKISI